MEPKRLFDGELRFLSIIWEHEPVPSGELVRLCEAELGWKKSTTYTMLKRLAEKCPDKIAMRWLSNEKHLHDFTFRGYEETKEK